MEVRIFCLSPCNGTVASKGWVLKYHLTAVYFLKIVDSMVCISPLINRTHFQEAFENTETLSLPVLTKKKIFFLFIVFWPSHCHFKAIFEKRDIVFDFSGETTEQRCFS